MESMLQDLSVDTKIIQIGVQKGLQISLQIRYLRWIKAGTKKQPKLGWRNQAKLKVVPDPPG